MHDVANGQSTRITCYPAALEFDFLTQKLQLMHALRWVPVRTWLHTPQLEWGLGNLCMAGLEYFWHLIYLFASLRVQHLWFWIQRWKQEIHANDPAVSGELDSMTEIGIYVWEFIQSTNCRSYQQRCSLCHDLRSGLLRQHMRAAETVQLLSQLFFQYHCIFQLTH